MIVLHIAAIDNNPFNGVCVAAPQHVISQKEYAEVGFINIKNVEIEEFKEYPGTQMEFVKPFDINELPEPYNKPDLVVFHECYRKEYLRIAKNLKKNKTPYIVMPHGELRIEAQQKKRLKKSLANILLFNRFVNQAIAIQCLSEAEMKATHFGKNRFIGTNGISVPKRKKTHFNNDNVKFIYIGRYEWKVKGLDLLFNAINQEAVFLRQNRCHFYLFGPDILGRLEKVTQLVQDNHIEDLITLNKEITGKEKEKVLLESDVFVQTSRHEGMPMGILEAMSYGIPCIVTKGTSLSEDINNAFAGWDAGNSVNEIGRALRKAIDDRNKWGEMGLNGIEYVTHNYSWDNISIGTIRKYKSFIE